MPLNLKGLLDLSANFTVARILERDDFHNRFQKNLPISLHEFLYPVMQAYDSVMIKADVELGGTDQLFNLLAGRELMEKMDMEPQVCITLPLLEGTDGVQKMSKSYGNYVGVNEDANEMFGKLMSIPDNLMPRYLKLASNFDVEKIEKIIKGLDSGSLHPNKVKRDLSKNIVSIYHNEQQANLAEQRFDTIHKNKQIPDDIPVYTTSFDINENGMVYLAKLLVESGMAKSAGEARRLIDGNGVKINQKACKAKQYYVKPNQLNNSIIQVGKRKFVKIIES